MKGEFEKRIESLEKDIQEAIEDSGEDSIGIDFKSTLKGWIGEARKEMPLEMFDYKQPRKWNLLEYQQHYDALAHQVLELLLWFEKWFGSDENEEVKKENE